jgi:hypothetical protein
MKFAYQYQKSAIRLKGLKALEEVPRPTFDSSASTA